MNGKAHLSRSRLRWLEGERAGRRSNWLGYNVTIFNARGRYPEGIQRVPGGVFSADSDIVFSVVGVDRQPLTGNRLWISARRYPLSE